MLRENIRRISGLRRLLKGFHYTHSGIEELTKSWLGYALGVSIDYKMTDTIDADGFAAKKIEFLEIPPSKKAKKNRFIIAQCAAENEEFTFSSIGLAERLRNCHKDLKALVKDFSKNGLLPESGVISHKMPHRNEIYRVLVWNGYILAAWNVKYNKIYVSTKASYHYKEFARLLKEFVDFAQSCLNGRNETAVLKYARFEY